MGEESWPWPGTTVGDAGPYSDDDWDNMWETLYGSGMAPYNNRGVIRNWLNELVVTSPGVNAADVATGAALVHGKFYRNTDVVNVVGIPNAAGGVGHTWREDLICVRSSWIAQTIRVYRHANPADEVAYPAPTQTDGTCWEIPLAAVRIDVGGVITLITDLRDYVSDLMQPKQIQAQAIASLGSGGTYEVAGWRGVARLDGIGQYCAFSLEIPSDFISLISAVIWAFTDANGTFNWDLAMGASHCDEATNAVTDTKAPANKVAVANTVYCLDASTALGGIEPGHHIGVYFDLNALGACVAVNVATLVIKYR